MELTNENKTSNMSEYMKKYRTKNKNKFYEIIECPICKIKYNKSNKSHHIRTRNHVAKCKISDLESKMTQLELILNNS